MSIKPIAKFVYGFFGSIFLVIGIGVLLLRTGLLPEAVKNMIFDEAEDNLNAVHLIQEFGALLVFAGLITFWFIRHYERSKAFHWAMTTFWGLLALAHWFDVRGPVGSIAGPLINTVPFLIFVIVGLLRNSLESTDRPSF